MYTDVIVTCDSSHSVIKVTLITLHQCKDKKSPFQLLTTTPTFSKVPEKEPY